MAEEENIENNKGENESSSPYFFTKIFAPLKLLINIHLKIAAKEFEEDSSRLTSGCIFIAIGSIFILTFLILINAVAIGGIAWALSNFFDSTFMIWFISITSWTVLILIIGGLLIASGSGKFKKRFFNKTRELVEETWKEIS